MSKIDSRLRRIRRTKAYRKAMIVINICFIIIIGLVAFYGCLFTFTKKREYRDKGVEYYNQQNYEEAIKCFEKALDYDQWFSDKLNVDIELHRAESYLKLDDFYSANQVYRDIYNKYSNTYYNALDIDYMIKLTDALILFSEGDYVSSVDTINKAVSDGYSELAIYSAICYEHLCDYENMRVYYDVYIEKIGLNSYVAYKYAQYYILNNDYNNALSYVEQGIALTDTSYLKDLMYLKIVCYMEQGSYDTAFSLAESFVASYPNDTKGEDIYELLYTRVYPNTTPINDKFDLTEDPND
ncbi:MAG: tetratricopeptide repeat protein [Lachnospiraceae bacterium]|nr:tetratricopeptide repeat protein [Lachnospiraceae bacterium]